jgi:hypothetical protein
MKSYSRNLRTISFGKDNYLVYAAYRHSFCLLRRFRSVQAEYEAEGIELDEITFEDNAPILDLIEGRMGYVGCAFIGFSRSLTKMCLG